MFTDCCQVCDSNVSSKDKVKLTPAPVLAHNGKVQPYPDLAVAPIPAIVPKVPAAIEAASARNPEQPTRNESGLGSTVLLDLAVPPPDPPVTQVEPNNVQKPVDDGWQFEEKKPEDGGWQFEEKISNPNEAAERGDSRGTDEKAVKKTNFDCAWDAPQRETNVQPDYSARTNQSVLKFDTVEHQQPLQTLHIVLIFFAIALPNAALLAGFSTIGFGLDVYNKVADKDTSQFGDMLLGSVCLYAGFLMICDWFFFPLLAKVLTGAVGAFGFLLGTLFKGRKYPWAIMLLVLFGEPAALGTIRFSLCIQVRRQKFYAAISVFALCAAFVISAVWAWYIYIDDNRWDRATKDDLIAKTQPVYDHVYKERPLNYTLDCGPDKQVGDLDKNEKADIKYACSQASTLWFLAWTCPFIAIGCNTVISAFTFLTGVIANTESIAGIQRQLTRFLIAIAFLLSGMYCTASMSATSIRLGSTMLAFFSAAVGILCVWGLLEIDTSQLAAAAKTSKMMQMLVKLWNSDWSKALFVGALGGPGLCFFFLNYVTQQFRIIRAGADNPECSFTPLAQKMVDSLKLWSWTSILLKICLLGELFFMLQVGVAKATYVFLSWLNTELADTDITMVVVLVYIIGCTMFLLPPVPGLPVYIFAGILLGEKGRQNESIGFWLGCVIAIGLSIFTKLCACVGQYMIGYYMGKSIKVQQLIGVDKVPTRAIEKVLKSRGLNPWKVALLVGGPDWPTSVTCGIVRVNIPQMLIGTLPVLTLLTPCIFAGACMGRVKPGEDNVWNMAANGFTLTAAAVNMASMAYAVYAIGVVIQRDGDELAKPRPEHEAVAELTRREQEYVDAYNATLAWSNLSRMWKCVVLMAACLMLISNGAFTLFAEMCFRPFALSSKIDAPYEEDGLDGKAHSIIKPMGFCPLGGFALGVLCHIVFVKEMVRRTKRLLGTKAKG